MTDRPRELGQLLHELALIGLELAAKGKENETATITKAARFIEQSLTPPEGDTVSEGVVEAVRVAPSEEPTMPGLSAHFPEMEYLGGAQYRAKCDCGFVTGKPGNYYVAKALWADHAIAALQSRVSPQAGMREALEERRKIMATWGDKSAGNGLPEAVGHQLALVNARIATLAALSTAPIPMSEDAK